MKWSNEIPTQEGWYWVKDGPDGKAVIRFLNIYDLAFITSQYKTPNERKMTQFKFYLEAAKKSPNPEDEKAVLESFHNLQLEQFTTYYQGPLSPNE